MHLKQMRACGNACHARSRIARFGHVHHIRDVNTVASQYRSALVRVLMCAPKVVPCVGHFCGAWLIGFKPRGKTSIYRVTALANEKRAGPRPPYYYLVLEPANIL